MILLKIHSLLNLRFCLAICFLSSLASAISTVSDASFQQASPVYRLSCEVCWILPKTIQGFVSLRLDSKSMAFRKDFCRVVTKKEVLLPFRFSSIRRSLTNLFSKDLTITNTASHERHIADHLFESLRVDSLTVQKIQKLKQGSPDWLSARRLRLTASNFGTAVGHNPWKTPDDLVEDMLFEKFKGNDATRWGNDKEAIARNLYILKKRAALSAQLNVSLKSVDFQVYETGLHIWDECSWLAASPDGLVRENGDMGLLEIKCPFSMKLYPQIPDYYADQIQGIMGILGCSWCDFVVWTPSAMSIERVPFDKKYWQEQLLPALKDFYMTRFVPRYVANELTLLGNSIHTKKSEKKSLSRWIDPSSPSGASKDENQAQPSWLSVAGPHANMSGFDGFVSGVVEVNERLERNSLRLEYAGSSNHAIFLALAAQLQRQGLLPRHYDTRTPIFQDTRTDFLDKAAWQVRFDLVAHISAHALSFEVASGRSRADILERLSVLSGATGAAGALELAAAAQYFGVHIVCLIVSSKGVDERHFYPSLQHGPESLSAARGRLVLSSAGDFVWSSVPLSRSAPVGTGGRLNSKKTADGTATRSDTSQSGGDSGRGPAERMAGAQDAARAAHEEQVRGAMMRP
jgi:putative phage-type endonuclease